MASIFLMFSMLLAPLLGCSTADPGTGDDADGGSTDGGSGDGGGGGDGGSTDGGSGDGGGSTDGGSTDGGSSDGGSSDGGSSDGGSSDGGSTVDPCEDLPPPGDDALVLDPDQAGELRDILLALEPDTEVVLQAGTYDIDGDLWILAPGVTLRGETGDPDDVIIDADYNGGSVLTVSASDVTVAHLTLRHAWFHGVHVRPVDDDITGVRLHDIVVLDPAQQGIKINQDGSAYADQGVIRCSRIELTAEGRAQVRDNCYTGGIDAHRTRGWVVQDNLIQGFWCDVGLSEHGIHFWRQNRDTVIERNLIVDCARGIGLGLVDSSGGDERTWPDVDCPEGAYIDDYSGTVRNNMVYVQDPDLFASTSGFDGGVSLASACDATVVHNTVWSTQEPFASMEYRFAGTTALFANNLVSHQLRDRGVTSVELAGNIEYADAALLVDADGGDLHLAPDSLAADVGVDVGVADDIDGHPRDASPDVGADELP